MLSEQKRYGAASTGTTTLQALNMATSADQRNTPYDTYNNIYIYAICIQSDACCAFASASALTALCASRVGAVSGGECWN